MIHAHSVPNVPADNDDVSRTASPVDDAPRLPEEQGYLEPSLHQATCVLLTKSLYCDSGLSLEDGRRTNHAQKSSFHGGSPQTTSTHDNGTDS